MYRAINLTQIFNLILSSKSYIRFLKTYYFPFPYFYILVAICCSLFNETLRLYIALDSKTGLRISPLSNKEQRKDRARNVCTCYQLDKRFY